MTGRCCEHDRAVAPPVPGNFAAKSASARCDSVPGTLNVSLVDPSSAAEAVNVPTSTTNQNKATNGGGDKRTLQGDTDAWPSAAAPTRNHPDDHTTPSFASLKRPAYTGLRGGVTGMSQARGEVCKPPPPSRAAPATWAPVQRNRSVAPRAVCRA
jgi:hypothetical protein